MELHKGESEDYMRTLNNVKKMILINPLSIIFTSIAVYVFCILEQYILFPLLYSLLSLNSWNFSDSIISLIRLLLDTLYNKAFIGSMVIITVLILVALAILMGIVFSGLLYTAYCTVESKNKFGLKMLIKNKYTFIRNIIISLIVLIVAAILFNIFLVAAVPAVFLALAAKITNNIYYYFLFLLSSFLTAVVFYIIFTYYRIYTFFWYISSQNFEKSCFTIGKKFANIYFSTIIRKIFLFDFIFVLYQISIIFIDYNLKSMIGSLSLLFCNWAFKTIFLLIYIIKFFLLYKLIKQKLCI